MATSSRRSWLTALAVCAAMIVVPVLAWLLIPKPEPGRPTRPLLAPRPARIAPIAPAPDGNDAQDGARIVFGTITSEGGQPIERAEILIEGYGRIRTRSDGQGNYRLRAVPLDALEVIVRADSHLERRMPLGEGKPGEKEQLDVQLTAAPNVTGLVTAPGGEPIERALVSCGDGQDPGLVTVTQANGRFKMPPRAAGCKAVASHMHYGDSPATVLRGGDDNELQMTKGASISGVVVDSSGRPLSSYTVAIDSFKPAKEESRVGRRNRRKSVNDPEGRFELTALPPGSYVLAVKADGMPPGSSDNIELGKGEQVRGVRIQMELGGALKGVITDASSGEPIAGANVRLDITTMAGRSSRARSDDSGQYLLEGLPTKPFSLRVSAAGYTGKILSGLTTTAGGTGQQDIALNKLGDGEERGTEYSGVGIQLGMSSDGVRIGRVFSGGPGEAAGLQVGDVVMLIDGADASSFTVSQAVEKIRGPSGTRISLTVQRKTGERASVVVERGDVKR